MTPETKKQALVKLHAVTNKIGYPEKWRDYSRVRSSATMRSAIAAARTQFEFARAAREDRQARRQERMADDAADRERVLRPAA